MVRVLRLADGTLVGEPLRGHTLGAASAGGASGGGRGPCRTALR